MINLEKTVLGAFAGGGTSVALSQVGALAGDMKIAGAAYSDPMNWFMVAAVSGACAGAALAALLTKDD